MATRKKQPSREGFTTCLSSMNDLNMSLCWTYQEYGVSSNGKNFSRAHALLWSIKPSRILASVDVFNGEYSITIQCPEGLNRWTRDAVERHLGMLNMVMSKKNGWIQG